MIAFKEIRCRKSFHRITANLIQYNSQHSSSNSLSQINRSNLPNASTTPQAETIIDMEPIESTTHSTELYELPEAPSTWTSEAEQRVRAAQFGAMEKAVAAYTQVNQNLKAGGAGGAPLSQEAAERKFLRENRQESRPGADLNPVTSSTPVTTRQFLENKTGTASKLTSAVRVMHAKEDAQSYKTPTQQLWEDYWLVRPTLENFESLVEEKIAKARRSGQFDNLPGKGKPLEILTSDLGANPYLSDTERIMNRMLQSQGHAPGWVELGKDIDTEIVKLKKEIANIWDECFRSIDEPSSKATSRPPAGSGLAGRMISWITGPQPSQTFNYANMKTGEALWKEKSRKWAEVRVKGINEMVI